jgi:hypothetical protein
MNHTNSPLRDVEVIYDDGALDFKSPSDVQAHAGVSNINGFGMPPLPKTVTVKWRDKSDTYYSAIVKIPESIRDLPFNLTPHRGSRSGVAGDLIFDIGKDDPVTVSYKDPLIFKVAADGDAKSQMP